MSGRQVLGSEPLPQPRKKPRQSRSRALVDAVVQACLQILDEEGAQALSVNRIAERSGAAVGSIYQYFGNKEAIVAQVCEQVLDEETQALQLLTQTVRGLPLAQALHIVLANVIRVERRLARLDRAFVLRHHGALHLGMWRGSYASAQEFTDATWLRLLDMYAQEVTAPDRRLAAYMVGRGLRGLIRQVLEDVPERLDSPELLATLVAMAMGCLRPGD